jgi:RNA recognition motif-containing protein
MDWCNRCSLRQTLTHRHKLSHIIHTVALNVCPHQINKAGAVLERPELTGRSLLELGKLDTNDLVMEHPSVSRWHALLLITTNKAAPCVLIDLAAANGTFVDGARLRPWMPTPVTPDSILTFGLSKRNYVISNVSTDVAEKARRALYSQLADPSAGDPSKAAVNTIYVGNLPHGVSDAAVRDLFEPCGGLLECRVPRDRETGDARGFAFLTFSTLTGASRALAMNDDEFQGRELKVKRQDAEHKKPTAAAGGSGRGDGGSGRGRGGRSGGSKQASSAADSGPSYYGPTAGAGGDRSSSEQKAAVAAAAAAVVGRSESSSSRQQQQRQQDDSSSSAARGKRSERDSKRGSGSELDRDADPRKREREPSPVVLIPPRRREHRSRSREPQRRHDSRDRERRDDSQRERDVRRDDSRRDSRERDRESHKRRRSRSRDRRR